MPTIQQMRQAGFTLIELMIAVVVVAILGVIAIPAYNNYVTESKLPEAFSSLLGLGQNLETFYQDNKTYVGACQAGTEAALPVSSDFTFSCPTLAADAWTIEAVGNPGTSLAGFAFTLDSQGGRVTVSAPAGWVAQGACWTRDKSGDCAS